jgi:hypothetical protein
MGNYLKVQGVQTVTNAIKRKGKAIEEGVKMNVEKYGALIAAQAQSNAPKVASTFEGTISIDGQPSKAGLSYIIQARNTGNDDVAAWYEFGTGKSYLQMQGSYTPEMKRIATSYYKNGKGTIKAHPYLFPAYYKYRKEFIKAISQLVKKVV